MNEQNIFDFKVLDIKGAEVSLNDYSGKVLLIVNTATACGYTNQLRLLQRLYIKYKQDGLEILAFPSNDFGDQEPLSNNAIEQFCKQEYSVTFPVFAKIHVKGIEAHPLYQFMSNKKRNGKIQSKPLWNFHKYLVDRNGMVRDYFLTITTPENKNLIKKIELLLGEKSSAS